MYDFTQEFSFRITLIGHFVGRDIKKPIRLVNFYCSLYKYLHHLYKFQVIKRDFSLDNYAALCR
jgi:hypothetical protein